MLKKQIVGLRIGGVAAIIFGFLLSGCGSSENSVLSSTNPTPAPTGSDSVSVSAWDQCMARLKSNNQDTDGDGVTDYDELNGYNVIIGGAPVIVYSNPQVADTDGDGVNDGAEQTAGHHPAYQNYDLKVYATGGANGTAITPASGASGWNLFDNFKINPTDVVTIQDLRTQKWGNSTNVGYADGVNPASTSGAKFGNLGTTNCNTTMANAHVCLSAAPVTSLIAKLGALTVANDNTRTETGTAITQFGSLMAAPNFSATSKGSDMGADSTKTYLMLRMNDSDSLSALNNNKDFVEVLVTIQSDTSYQQRLRTSDEESALISVLCP